MAEEMGQAQGRVILHQGEKTENLYKRHSVCLLTCKKDHEEKKGEGREDRQMPHAQLSSGIMNLASSPS